MEGSSPNRQKKTPVHWMDGVIGMAYIVCAVLIDRLYVHMVDMDEGPLGTYLSDIGVHISEGLTGHGYSLAEWVYHLLLVDLALPRASVAVFLSIVSVLTVYVTYRLFRALLPDISPRFLHLAAFSTIFLHPIRAFWIHPTWYLGLQSGACWHSDTFVVMRLFGTLVFLYVLTIIDRYKDTMPVKNIVIYTVLLCLVNFAKPNFIVAYAPAMAIMLIIECIRTKGSYFRNEFLFALPIALSMIVLIFQALILFGGGSSSGSGQFPIGVSLAYVLRLRAPHPILSLLLSAAFPLWMLLLHRKDVRKNAFLSFSVLFYLVGLFEFLFLHENGERMTHGNLSWGYSYCVFLGMALATAFLTKDLCKLYQRIKKDGAYRPSDLIHVWKEETWYGIPLLIACALYLAHLLSGLRFFQLLYLGMPYIN